MLGGLWAGEPRERKGHILRPLRSTCPGWGGLYSLTSGQRPTSNVKVAV